MKHGRVGLHFGLLLSVLAASLVSHARATPAPQVQTGLVVLDNCDPAFRDKDAYADNVSLVGGEGKVRFRVSGLNNCESIGSSHMVAADPKRGWIWMLENVGNRIHKYDRAGRERLVLKDIEASALSVDPETGNLWVLTAKGTIYGDKSVVFNAEGKQIASHDIAGFDIAYDRKSKSFWIAGRDLVKVSNEGEVLFRKQIAPWCSSSLAVHAATGTVWVAVRKHPHVPGSQNELLAFDNAGKAQRVIALGQHMPFHVSVDAHDGSVWLTLFRKSVRRYTQQGALGGEYEAKALAAEADTRSGSVWVVTAEETQLVSRKGEVSVRVKHKSQTSEAWIAPWE